jgi:hypothetical protein
MFPLCTFVSFVVDEVQMLEPQRTRRFTKEAFKESCQTFLRRRPSNPGVRFGHADNHGASAREFFFGDFGEELQVQAETPAFLKCYVVEEINYVATKSLFGAAAFIEVEGAGRVHFQSACVSQDGTEFALEIERSLPYLRHGESDYVEGHRSRPSIADERPVCPAGLQLTSGVSYV